MRREDINKVLRNVSPKDLKENEQLIVKDEDANRKEKLRKIGKIALGTSILAGLGMYGARRGWLGSNLEMKSNSLVKRLGEKLGNDRLIDSGQTGIDIHNEKQRLLGLIKQTDGLQKEGEQINANGGFKKFFGVGRRKVNEANSQYNAYIDELRNLDRSLWRSV